MAARFALSLVHHLRALGLPEPEPEYHFARPRRWRFDWAYPDLLIAMEREGGVWTGGRHVRGQGFLGDLEKYNEAALRGWLLIRYTPQMEASGEAAALVARAVQARRGDL